MLVAAVSKRAKSGHFMALSDRFEFKCNLNVSFQATAKCNMQKQQPTKQRKRIFAPPPRRVLKLFLRGERLRYEQHQTANSIDQLESSSAAQIDTAVIFCVQAHKRTNTATHPPAKYFS